MYASFFLSSSLNRRVGIGFIILPCLAIETTENKEARASNGACRMSLAASMTLSVFPAWIRLFSVNLQVPTPASSTFVWLDCKWRYHCFVLFHHILPQWLTQTRQYWQNGLAILAAICLLQRSLTISGKLYRKQTDQSCDVSLHDLRRETETSWPL